MLIVDVNALPKSAGGLKLTGSTDDRSRFDADLGGCCRFSVVATNLNTPGSGIDKRRGPGVDKEPTKGDTVIRHAGYEITWHFLMTLFVIWPSG